MPDQLISGHRFLEALRDAGVISGDDHIRRVVIDAAVEGIVVMYVERYGDTRILQVASSLAGVEIAAAPLVDDALVPAIREALLVQPGQRVLLRLNPDRTITRADQQEVLDRVREFLPDVEVGLVVADEIVAVDPPVADPS